MLKSGSKPVFRNLAFRVYRTFEQRHFSLNDLKKSVFSQNLALASSFCTTGLALGMVVGSESSMQFSGRFIPPPERKKKKKPSGQQVVDCFRPENPRPRGAAPKPAGTPNADVELLQNIMWAALLVSGGERIRPSTLLEGLRRAYERFEVPSDAARATMGDVQRALKQFVAEAKLTRHAPGVPSSEPSYTWVSQNLENGWERDLAMVQIPLNNHEGCFWVAEQWGAHGDFTYESLKAHVQKSKDCPVNNHVMIDFIVKHMTEIGVISKGSRRGTYSLVFKPQPPL